MDRVDESEDAQRADLPLYRAIVKALQSEIVRGIYPVGSPLPSETALVERFEVSRHTIREALRYLREAGLVTSHQGRGTIVRGPGRGRGYAHHINTISDLFPVNVETVYAPAERPMAPLPGWAAEALGDGPGKWLRIDGSRTRPGETKPFNQVIAFVPARFAGVGRVAGTASGPLYAAIEMIYGDAIGLVQQQIGSFAADAERGGPIGMAAGEPGIEVQRTFRLASDESVALLSFNYYPLEAFSFAMELRRVRE